MSSSAGSGGVVGECAWWSAEAVVESDRGCEREESCLDAGCEAVESAGAVAFEGEDVLAGLEDGFDSLPDGREVGPAGGFVFTAWPDDGGVEAGGGGFEVAAGVALVADDPEVLGVFAAFEQGQADVSFGRLRRGEHERPGGAVECEQAVQSEAPEVAAVACAVAVVGRISELAATGRLDAAGALDRRRIDQHQVVIEAGAVACEYVGEPFDRVAQPLAPLEVAGSVGQRGKQVPEPFAGGFDEAGVRWDPHQRLRHREGDDLRVGQDAPGVLSRLRQEIVSGTEHGNQQQVEVGEHRVPPRSTVRIGTADFDLAASSPYRPDTPSAVELLI